MTEKDKEPEELIRWICWRSATTAERFYPPDETARECVEVFREERMVTDYDKGVEYGSHARAFDEMVELFEAFETFGYGPKTIATEYAEEHGLEKIDWTWYEETNSLGDD